MCLAVPGKILEIRADAPLRRTGRVDFGGAIQEVNLVSVPEAGAGDYVIVHAGCAVTTIPESDARQILDYLAQMEDRVADGAGAGLVAE
jgi:hydrogenase expression/formation protein HypC